MIKRVSTAEAKAHLSALMTEVADGEAQVIIERRGEPLAALVGLDRLRGVLRAIVPPEGGRGALALVGAGNDLTDKEIEALVADIYERRDSAISRLVMVPE